MTGSGIYLEAMIGESRKHGFSTYRVAGVPADTIPSLKDRPLTDGAYVRFESGSINFPVTGMSDVMPYKSFCSET
ncbi:hypothetical protein [uncultured Desulfosarcina sp.]|uniref:hypothetical protein n=1 Tax=uncultured Desulfosarcina sp. TaxID=218289 RepID=UPI0029C92FE9|nr:hypothetical protein [uncultured Desulfosarcina sp.]